MQKQNTVEKPVQDVFIWEKDVYNFLICQFTTNNEFELFRQKSGKILLGRLLACICLLFNTGNSAQGFAEAKRVLYHKTIALPHCRIMPNSICNKGSFSFCVFGSNNT